MVCIEVGTVATVLHIVIIAKLYKTSCKYCDKEFVYSIPSYTPTFSLYDIVEGICDNMARCIC